jgi:GNAT superfamily N-acetyltransferase
MRRSLGRSTAPPRNSRTFTTASSTRRGVLTPPDYRITCIYVDKRHRRGGLAALALHGALELIAQAGGGRVDGYPQDTPGRKVNPSFLYNATRHTYEEAGFVYDRAKGKNHCVMTKTVERGS